LVLLSFRLTISGFLLAFCCVINHCLPRVQRANKLTPGAGQKGGQQDATRHGNNVAAASGSRLQKLIWPGKLQIANFLVGFGILFFGISKMHFSFHFHSSRV